MTKEERAQRRRSAREKDRERKRAKRQNPTYRQMEQERDRERKKALRSDVTFRALEKIRDRMRKERKRFGFDLENTIQNSIVTGENLLEPEVILSTPDYSQPHTLNSLPQSHLVNSQVIQNKNRRKSDGIELETEESNPKPLLNHLSQLHPMHLNSAISEKANVIGFVPVIYKPETTLPVSDNHRSLAFDQLSIENRTGVFANALGLQPRSSKPEEILPTPILNQLPQRLIVKDEIKIENDLLVEEKNVIIPLQPEVILSTNEYPKPIESRSYPHVIQQLQKHFDSENTIHDDDEIDVKEGLLEPEVILSTPDTPSQQHFPFPYARTTQQCNSFIPSKLQNYFKQ